MTMDPTRILIIDDDESLAEMIKMNLESFGPYDVRVEISGKQGFRTAVSFQPHLILLDVVMKDMDGRDVLNLIRADQQTKNIPVVFLTALAPENIMNGKPGRSYSGILSKPIVLDDLLRCIESCRQQEKS